MYHVSDAFKRAVDNGAEQRIFLRFNGRDFTNEDVDVDNGVILTEVFNGQTDFHIGQCTSAEISFKLFNDDYHLENFTFGEFSAYLGVKISSSSSTAADGITISSSQITYTHSGVRAIYEYIRLGVFIAPRPAVVRKYTIDVEANDRMTLFDVDMPSAAELGISYPITAGELLRSMCQYVGVSATSYSFLNSDVSLSEEPSVFATSTMREVLAQIAELAGANARFNRYGQLTFSWFNSTGIVYDEHDYSAFEPSWYQTPPITALHIRNADSTEESIIGGGDTRYMVQNNVFLRMDDSPSEPEPEPAPALMMASAYAAPRASSPSENVYSRLSSAPTIHPASANLFGGMELEAGDVVTVKSDTRSYALPVYAMTMDWHGATTTTIESTGNEKREPLPALSRKEFAAGRGGYGAQKLNEEKFKEYETHFYQTDQDIGLIATRAELDELKQKRITAYAQINVNANAITAEVARAQGAEGNLSSRITQTAESITSEVERASAAEGALSSRITQTADSITSLVNKTGVNELGANETLYSKVTQTAEAITSEVARAQGAEGNLSSRITQTAESITTKVSKGEVISSINQTAEEIKISASKINLDGYVKASELEAESAKINNILSGATTATLLSTTALHVSNGFTFRGNVVDSHPLTVGTKRFSYLSINADNPNKIEYSDLPHSHKVSVAADGTVTLGEVATTGGSFNIADTRVYQEGVSAAYTRGQNSVSVTKGAWNGGIISFTTSAGTGAPKSVQLSKGTVTWDGNSASFPIMDGLGSTGYTCTVNAKARYDAGVEDGKASVTQRTVSSAAVSGTITWDSGSNDLTVPVKITMSDGTSVTKNVTVDGTKAYNAGHTDGVDSVYVTEDRSHIKWETSIRRIGSLDGKVTVVLSNGKTYSRNVTSITTASARSVTWNVAALDKVSVNYKNVSTGYSNNEIYTIS